MKHRKSGAKKGEDDKESRLKIKSFNKKKRNKLNKAKKLLIKP